MQVETLSNSNKSLNNKKPKNKINAKTSSTNIDSYSQKHDSNSNSNSENNHNIQKRNVKNDKDTLISLNNYEITKNTKKNYIYLPINELKQFKTWNSSNLNAIYQNILATEQENYLHVKPCFTNHLDINEIHRTILVDWLINVHLYFKLSDECLYLTIKLIDFFLARTVNFTKNKLQLLGICSLQISSKYIEGIHPSISNLSDLCDKCYTKKEIIQFEKYLLQINDYIIEQNQLLNYYDLLCLILKFNIKYYYFGKMLLDLTLLDINFYKYQKNVIIFAICSLVICNSKMIDELIDYFELYIKESKEGKYKLEINDLFKRVSSNDNYMINNLSYLFSFFPSKDYFLVSECANKIIDLYEKTKESKYNSAIQKLFIQLKEIKIESIMEHQKEISSENKNESTNRNEESQRESNEDVNMIIID